MQNVFERTHSFSVILENRISVIAHKCANNELELHTNAYFNPF